MRYGLTQIPQSEFDTLHTFVKACFDEGRQRFSPTLETIGTNFTWFPEVHQDYLASNVALGTTMEISEEHQKKFHIWITPQYKEPVFKFYMTLVHELVHGYAGLKYGHNAHWRRWFHRVMWHAIAAKVIPEPDSSVDLVLYSVECNYNYGTPESAYQLVRESISQAWKEHSKILDNYWRRLECPVS